jgi:uncharacterized membrane protein
MDWNLEERFWEIDLLRGVAILMMIGYHIHFDLDYFGAYNLNVQSGFWLYFARNRCDLSSFGWYLTHTQFFTSYQNAEN